jgi:hypothetical protein
LFSNSLVHHHPARGGDERLFEAHSLELSDERGALVVEEHLVDGPNRLAGRPAAVDLGYLGSAHFARRMQRASATATVQAVIDGLRRNPLYRLAKCVVRAVFGPIVTD